MVAVEKQSDYTIETYANEREWLQARLVRIGSSNAAAIVGLGRDRGQYSIWAEKTSPLQSQEYDEMCDAGHRAEPMIAKWFEDQAIKQTAKVKGVVHDPGDYAICSRIDSPHHACTPDRFLISDFNARRILAEVSLKTAYYDQAQIWLKRVPLPYVIQSQWIMHVCGLDVGYIAVLCNGYQFRWHRINRHERMIRKLVLKVDEFWERHVLARVAPPVDATASTSRWLARLYAESEPTTVDLPQEMEPLGQQYDRLSAVENGVKKRKTLIQNQVKAALGIAEQGRLVDGSGFAWRGKNGSRRFARKERVRYDDE